MTRILLPLAAVVVVHAVLVAQSHIDSANPVGSVVAIENDFVRVHYALYEPPPRRRSAPDPPVVVYVRVEQGAGTGISLEVPVPSKRERPSWRPGVLARGIQIELRRPVPPVSDLGEPGTDLPPNAIEQQEWPGGQFILATYRPLDYGVGAGRYPSVTTFLSDGVIEVWNRRETRRRMAVQAGDTFWFEARTRITVVDDFPISAVIVQLRAGR
jgi:hypothetical protein